MQTTLVMRNQCLMVVISNANNIDDLQPMFGYGGLQ